MRNIVGRITKIGQPRTNLQSKGWTELVSGPGSMKLNYIPKNEWIKHIIIRLEGLMLIHIFNL